VLVYLFFLHFFVSTRNTHAPLLDTGHEFWTIVEILRKDHSFLSCAGINGRFEP
jgi:hypothetical protein